MFFVKGTAGPKEVSVTGADKDSEALFIKGDELPKKLRKDSETKASLTNGIALFRRKNNAGVGIC